MTYTRTLRAVQVRSNYPRWHAEFPLLSSFCDSLFRKDLYCLAPNNGSPIDPPYLFQRNPPVLVGVVDL